MLLFASDIIGLQCDGVELMRTSSYRALPCRDELSLFYVPLQLQPSRIRHFQHVEAVDDTQATFRLTPERLAGVRCALADDELKKRVRMSMEGCAKQHAS